MHLSSFPFNEERATEAAAYLIQKHGTSITRMRLLKLLYFADRASILTYGHPICGGTYVSMEHGPVLSEAYNCIKEDCFIETGSYWSTHLKGAGERNIEISQHPAERRLTRADKRILDSIHEENCQLSDWDVRNKSHDLPEWEDPGKSSIAIPVIRILRVAGKNNDEIAALAREREAHDHYDQLLG